MFWTPGGTPDFEKIIELSDIEFAEFYLNQMEKYRDNDGWWGEKGMPHCSECQQEIPGPTQLRRYYGNSMHASCFKQFYEREGNKEEKSEVMNKYWQRIASLILTPKRAQ